MLKRFLGIVNIICFFNDLLLQSDFAQKHFITKSFTNAKPKAVSIIFLVFHVTMIMCGSVLILMHCFTGEMYHLSMQISSSLSFLLTLAMLCILILIYSKKC